VESKSRWGAVRAEGGVRSGDQGEVGGLEFRGWLWANEQVGCHARFPAKMLPRFVFLWSQLRFSVSAPISSRTRWPCDAPYSSSVLTPPSLPPAATTSSTTAAASTAVTATTSPSRPASSPGHLNPRGVEGVAGIGPRVIDTKPLVYRGCLVAVNIMQKGMFRARILLTCDAFANKNDAVAERFNNNSIL
jgi:hypothetical protein